MNVRTSFQDGAQPEVEVRIIPTPAMELQWLREGIEIALKYLKEDPPRKTAAISTLMGTLAGEENCW
jgi:hypothetical protein